MIGRDGSVHGATMNYEVGKMKLAALAGYFRDGTINLIPPFQRGRVWTPGLRKKLLENVVRGKPIPAIFLYKEEAGSRYGYNILDGKQRLESILLFIGDQREDLSIPNWRNYFFRSSSAGAHFKINVAKADERAANKSFAELDDALVRNFREYSIPTIEIDMDKEEGGLKEVIDLFIDINQLGVRVTRFDIIRTMTEENRLLSDVFKLVAIRQKRRGDYFYKMIDSDFTSVLKRLQAVQGLEANEYQERVDRMWERLLEIVLFVRTGQHRTLAQILKAFLGKVDDSKITIEEISYLRKIFGLLKSFYSEAGVKTSRLAKDQPHFYTMVTSLHALGLIDKYGVDDLKRRLLQMSRIIDGKKSPPKGKAKALKEYLDLSSKQTTHPGRRATRQSLFVELVAGL
jgi:Protein of unknown function DUF262